VATGLRDFVAPTWGVVGRLTGHSLTASHTLCVNRGAISTCGNIATKTSRICSGGLSRFMRPGVLYREGRPNLLRRLGRSHGVVIGAGCPSFAPCAKGGVFCEESAFLPRTVADPEPCRRAPCPNRCHSERSRASWPFPRCSRGRAAQSRNLLFSALRRAAGRPRGID
jgi:hypothetical protein